MNLPLSALSFLEAAWKLCREGGVIHFYVLQSAEGEYHPLLRTFTQGEISERFVRSYSPTQHHAVYDIEVRTKSSEKRE
jgi:tRNA (guanine37-N1)-methyltransferase